MFLEVIDTKKAYGEGESKVQVLKGAGFSLEEKKICTILGPSGSGKSTLLNVIGGLETIDSGEVRIENTVISQLNSKELSFYRRDKLGFIFQFYNLVPNLSVEDNIMLPLILDGKKLKDYKGKLDEILDIIGMKAKRKMTPRELSGGQQQRVAIARALIFEPEIIFLDEPIGNLDSKTGAEIMELFRKINKEYGKTLVQVTHSEKSAEYGTSIIRLLDGQIVSKEVLEQEEEAI